jgi:hypothetical protein
METTDRKLRQTDPERKWIRLQEIGLVQFLAIPISILIVGLIVGWTIKGPATYPIGMGLFLGSLALGISGAFCFKTGYDKRVELRDLEGDENDTKTIKEP